MKFFYTNLIQAAATVISESSQVDTLPSENVADEMKQRVWRTGLSTALESITFDLGSAMAVTDFILYNHNLTASDSLILIQWSTDNVSFTTAATLTWSAGVISASFASQSKRYWKFTFTKSAAGETRDIGKIFLGTALTTADEPDFGGYEEKFEDLSRIIETPAGQSYTDRQSQRRMISLSCSDWTEAAALEVKTMVETVGRSQSFFIQVSTSLTAIDDIVYVKLDDAWGRKVIGLDSNLMWDLKGMKFQEQI